MLPCVTVTVWYLITGLPISSNRGFESNILSNETERCQTSWVSLSRSSSSCSSSSIFVNRAIISLTHLALFFFCCCCCYYCCPRHTCVGPRPWPAPPARGAERSRLRLIGREVHEGTWLIGDQLAAGTCADRAWPSRGSVAQLERRETTWRSGSLLLLKLL